MKSLNIRHATTYRYAKPVSFGPHRLMLRPRDSHDLRLVGTELVLSPPGEIRWLHDVFGNSIAIVTFQEPAQELSIVSNLQIERYALRKPVFEVDPEAASYPFVYSSDDRTDLGRTLERHTPDPTGILDEWARGFVRQKPMDTVELLRDLNQGIRNSLTYQARDEEGTQTPLQTLECKSGTCRDYAALMIEGARSLGFGARFVSGYLYDPKLDGAGDNGTQGAGATHAWAEIYLPGAGWIEFDPTNGLIGSEALIRVAVTRDAYQAVPVAGSFSGDAGDYLGMSVDVTVTAADDDVTAPAAPRQAAVA